MLKKMGAAIRLKLLLSLIALFIVALSFSVLYHLPMSWLLAQPSIQKQIPETLQLSPTHGTPWQGNTQISTLAPMSNHLGKIDWELSFWSLFIGQANVQSVWQKEQSQIRSQLKRPLLSEQTELNVTGIDGEIELPLLIKLLNLSDLDSMNVKGTLNLNNIDLAMDLQTQWPTVLTGNLILKQLNVLGETFPDITIMPNLKGDKLTLNIEGKEHAWSLSGQLEVLKNRQYTIDLTVTAQSPNTMPNWAEMLRKQSPVVAV